MKYLKINGTELFGDATPLAAGGQAADGFAALAAQDTNLDGVVNNLDANFANLRVWQDLNQDGISQAGELKTLAELGIASFNVASVNHSQMLANGNQIADTGTYTRTDGTTGTAGITAGMADVNLAVDTFHRVFADVVPVTAQTLPLPDMQGSGAVRDLKQAASLPTAAGAMLAAALGQYAASTRDGQLAQLDALLGDWGATSDLQGSVERVAAQNGSLVYLVPGLTRSDSLFGNFSVISQTVSGGGDTTTSTLDLAALNLLLGVADPTHTATLQAQQQRIVRLIGILEKFNGTCSCDFGDVARAANDGVFEMMRAGC